MDLMKQGRLMGNQHTHTVKLAEMLNRQREEQPELCDVSININGKEIKAHWCVLVSCPFFESMYSSGLAEKTSGKINLSICSAIALEKTLGYLYEGEIRMSMDDIVDLLEVSEYLQIEKLKKLCDEFLHNTCMDIKNCIKICLIGNQYDLSVRRSAERYIIGNLKKLMEESSEILQLSPETILSFLTDETLSYVTPDEFLIFILKWLKFDRIGRTSLFQDLLDQVDLTMVSNTCFDKVCHDPDLAIFQNVACEIDNRQKYGTKIEERKSLIKNAILVTCSEYYTSNNKSDRLYAFLIEDQKWKKISDLPCPITKPLIGFDGVKNIYVLESKGKYTYSYSGTVFRLYIYNTETKQWSYRKITLEDENFTNPDKAYVTDLIVNEEKIFLVVKGFRYMNGSRFAGYPVVLLLEVKQDDSIERHEVLRFSNETIVRACLLDQQTVGFIFELSADMSAKKTTGTEKGLRCKIVIYNFITKSMFTPSRWNPFMSNCLENCFIFSDNGVLVQLDFKTKIAKTYNPSTKSWGSLPKIEDFDYRNTDSSKYKYAYFKNELYVFGGLIYWEKQKIAKKYSFDQKKWISLADTPFVINDSAVCIAKVPAELVSCHEKCPHCMYNIKSSFSGYVNRDYDWNESRDDPWY